MMTMLIMIMPRVMMLMMTMVMMLKLIKSDNLMCKRVDDDTKLIFRLRAAAFE